MRALAQVASGDVRRLSSRACGLLRSRFSADEASPWSGHAIGSTVAPLLSQSMLCACGSSGSFAHGDRVSITDLLLVSHVIGAQSCGADLSRAGRLRRVADIDGDRSVRQGASDSATGRHFRGALRDCKFAFGSSTSTVIS